MGAFIQERVYYITDENIHSNLKPSLFYLECTLQSIVHYLPRDFFIGNSGICCALFSAENNL